jgi:diaminobutyrate-2-oxoglutarate transaminase
MIVMKFGGASLQDAAAVNQVVEIVSARLDRRPVVVVSAMAEFQDLHPFIGEVRGRGLMLGVEIIDPEETDVTGRPRGAGDLARKIQSECFSRGLILEVGGRHGAVLRLLPPLIITPEQTDQVCGILADACAAVGVEEYAYV